jgi:hypothetical protein
MWLVLIVMDRVPTTESIWFEEEGDDAGLVIPHHEEVVAGRRRRRRKKRPRGPLPTPTITPTVPEDGE